MLKVLQVFPSKSAKKFCIEREERNDEDYFSFHHQSVINVLSPASDFYIFLFFLPLFLLSVSLLSPSLCNSRSLIHFIDINSVGILYSVSRWNRNNLKQIMRRGESIVFIQNFVAWRFFQKIWLCKERMMSISSKRRERERWITFRTMTLDSSPLLCYLSFGHILSSLSFLSLALLSPTSWHFIGMWIYCLP